jgi:hypothetical protein
VAHHKHSIHSSEREEYVEYIFLAELCSYAWSVDRFVEVARAHTDAFGYDLLLSSNGIIRHLQLKSSVVGGRTRNQKVSLALEKKESGCVIWIKLAETTLKPHGYGWFGGSVGKPLPSLGNRVAKHTKANSEGIKSERKGQRVVSDSRFEWLLTMDEVFQKLFGP